MNLARLTEDHDGSGGSFDELNDLVVIGYTPIGAIKGNFGSIEVHARETVIPASNLVDHSIRFEFSTAGDYPQSSVGTINRKDIDSFVQALEKLEYTAIHKDRFQFTEVQYEVGEIKITVFNNAQNALMWAFQCESLSSHFNSMGKIGDLKRLVEQACAHLDAVRK